MDKGKVMLSLAGATEQGNIIYGITKQWNLLLEIEVEAGEVRILSVVPEWSSASDFSDILYWNMYLILVPSASRKIWLFSIEEGMWESILVPDYVTESGFGNFCTGYVQNNYLYLIGNGYRGVLKVDLQSKKVIKNIMVYENVLREQEEKKDGFTFANYVVLNHKLYIASGVSNSVHIINMEDDTYTDVIVGEEGSRYVGIAHDGSYFWLAARKGDEIIKWDGLSSVEIIKQGEEKNRYRYYGMFCTGQYIIVDGVIDKDTVWIDCKKCEIVKNKLAFPSPRRVLSNTRIWAEDEILYVVDKDSLEIMKTLALIVEVEKMKEYLGDNMCDIISKRGSILEEKLYDLHNYIECI